MIRAVLAGFAFVASAFAGCKCEANYSACREANSSNVVFIGTVEAVEPGFLDTWNADRKATLDKLNEEYRGAQGEQRAAGFERLRDAYLKVFPDLPPEHRRRLLAAKSTGELAELFYWILDHGKRVRLHVKTIFRFGGDDDDTGDDEPETLEVWTPFGECGVGFQVGETYLVYADSDEESPVIETSSCSRTRRVSDAGDDLAYLYFRKNSADAAGRIEGFLTSDVQYLKQRDRDHYADRIGAPVTGVVVEATGALLEGGDGARLIRRAESDEHGRVVFDGLPEGEYTLTVYAAGYPAQKRVISAPRMVKIDKRGCAMETVLATK